MIGIYKIVRKSDNKIVYIGQSTNIQRRIRQHLNGNASLVDREIHKDITNYIFSVVEECSIEELEEKEKYYIILYNTLSPNGFNLYLGTPLGYNSIGENNYKSVVNNLLVIQMRQQCVNQTINEV